MMVSDKRYKNLGYSFLLISLVWSIFYFFYSISDNSFSGLTLWFLFVLAHYIGIGIGALLILFRLLGFLKNRGSFIYIFFMFLNIVVGLCNLGFVMFTDVARSPTWFYMSFNLALGGISFIDIFLLELQGFQLFKSWKP
jgi:hypothetical protein